MDALDAAPMSRFQKKMTCSVKKIKLPGIPPEKVGKAPGNYLPLRIQNVSV
jgi:hypothetical protein